MLNQALDAGLASSLVGYESALQLSREYKTTVWGAALAGYPAYS